jgi:gluconolactonase
MISVFVDGLDHPECVALGPDGYLYAGGEAGQLYRIDCQKQSFEQFATSGGWILGIALDREGNVYACDPKRSELLRISQAGDVIRISDGTLERPMKIPNYPVFDAYGNLFVSDSGSWPDGGGCVYRIDSKGKTTLWSKAAPQFTNGLAISPDARWLYVVESTLPGITRIEILDSGAPGEVELVILLPGTVPDGIAFDVAGNLYIGCYRPDRVYLLNVTGDLHIFADDYQGTLVAAPTNVAFGGPTLQTLYIASLARWHIGAAEVAIQGQPLNYPAPISVGVEQ